MRREQPLKGGRRRTAAIAPAITGPSPRRSLGTERTCARKTKAACSHRQREPLMHTERNQIKGVKNSTKCLALLSQLLLTSPGSDTGASSPDTCLSQIDFNELFGVANSHHVIVRSFPPLLQILSAQGDSKMAERVRNGLDAERIRIQHGLSFLEPVCRALEDAGQVIVIKSLDHWPDLGSDLDLYTNAEASDVVAIMRNRFQAKPAERSWG